MPLKAGPNGTFRKYSSSNGRYVKDDSFLQLLINKPLTKKEKKRLKERRLQEELEQKAIKSPDPYLLETYREIQRHIPNSVKMINEDVYFPSDKKRHELDIVTKDSIIEIKSARKPHCGTQTKLQSTYANSRKMKHILYAPNISKIAMAEYTKKGINVINNLHSLIKELKK